MKFAHQSATIRQHGKGMIILETALETAGLTYVFPDGNGIKNIAFQVKRGEKGEKRKTRKRLCEADQSARKLTRPGSVPGLFLFALPRRHSGRDAGEV